MKALYAPHTPPRTKSRGFTLIEAIVVVGILSILGALAAPSMQQALNRYRMTAVYDELRATYMFARSEAIRTRQQVVVARVPAAPGCTSGSTQEWQCGWVVFADANADFTQQTATEPTLKVIAPAPGDVQVTHNAVNPGRIGFDRWGNGTQLGIGNYVFLPSSSASVSSPDVFTVCVSAGGRIRRLPNFAAICPP
jgi:type IV fimbrial biogenesis protein FimT